MFDSAFFNACCSHWGFCALCLLAGPVIVAALDWAHRIFERIVGEPE